RSASRRPLDVAAMVIVGGIYGYGASICLDRLLDRAPPAFHIGVVVDRFIAGGRSKQYEFRIQAYGHPEGATLDFVVSKALFDAGADGDEVCVAAHPGALHMPWYNLTPCARQTSQR
ncbi:MAG: hypothetical protein KGL69_10565, partial [Alphaproteobacteria bacterium]|nr:hypothetical protein [Alphaproteobacteria bacterium]